MSSTSSTEGREVPVKKKFKRRSGMAKSRRGCETCKARRVKCDETFPECNRCVNFWGKCEGYDKIALNRKSDDMIIIPRHAPLRPLAPVTIPSSPSITTHVFNDEAEQRYFQIYASEFAPRTVLSGTFNCVGLMTYIVPQACWTEPALRHACVALGALRLGQSQDFSDSTVSKSYDTKQLYEYALEQYQKTIKAMQKVKDIRTALLACLLIINVELNIRHPDPALRQLVTGIKLLDAYESHKPSVVSKENTVEDELVAAFKTFAIPLSAFGVTLALGTKDTMPKVLPIRFGSIDEARRYLEFECAPMYFKWKRFLRKDETMRRGTFIKMLFEGSMWTRSDTLRSSPEYIADQSALGEMYKAWFLATDELWKRVQRFGGRDMYRMAGLRCATYASQISDAGLLMQQCCFDKYLPQFQEIVSLIKGIMRFWEHEGKHPNVGQIDTGIAIPLMVVGLRCRHSATRREAIALLRKANQRQGFMDSEALALVVDFVRELEEGDEMIDFMPEESRVVLSEAWIDVQNRQLVATWDACKYFPEKVQEESMITW